MRTRSLLVGMLFSVSVIGQTYVRVRDDVVLPGGGVAGGTVSSLIPGAFLPCATLPVAQDGMAVPGGGFLSPASYFNPACLNRAGAIAFFANVTGSTRNQGIFVVDAAGLHAIAIGCGGGGGSGQPGTCGDATPIGGTFAGFFGGTVFAPAINDHGDVLFVADVVNGSAPRGLFLYLAAASTIIKIAAVGDGSPVGGTFTAIGPGSLNNYDEVVFLGMGATPYLSDLFLWTAGTVSTFAAVGQPAPGGGSMQMLGTESFGMADGTTIPIGPVPSINDCGQVAYRLLVQGGITSRGVVVRTNGVDAWYLKSGDPTPAGGSFFDFQGAAINGRGEIAVFTDYYGASSQPTSGWFAGSPGSYRSVLSFYDPVDGGQCLGLAYSRNPMTAIDDEGNVVVWCDISSAGNMGRLVLSNEDGTLSVLARQGDPTPIGGHYGSIDAWPSISSGGRATIDASAVGTSSPGTYFAAALCGPAIAASPCSPPGGSVRIDNFGPSTDAFVVFAALTATNIPLPPFGTLLIGPSVIVSVVGPALYPGVSGPHTTQLPLPGSPGLQGIELYFQSLDISGGTLQLTNATMTTLR